MEECRAYKNWAEFYKNKEFEKLKPLQKLNNNTKQSIKQYHDLGYGVPILGVQNYDEFCLKVT
jgi:hypothetical protein